MGEDIKISKPISIDTPRKEVFEFTAHIEGKKVNLLFLHRGKNEVWKTNSQRDQIFCQVWSKEKNKLNNRAVIEIQGVSPIGECQYSYHDKDQIVQAQVLLTLTHKPTHYKVQELSLRQFKQVQLSNALVELLKSLVELLLTPFAYLYQLVSGKGEPRDFAAMLVPVEHDHVGEISHEAVLSQIQFMGRLLMEEDPIDHSKDLGLTNRGEETVFFAGTRRPCRTTSTHYQFWMANATGHNVEATGFDESGFAVSQQVWVPFDEEDENNPVWVPFKRDDEVIESIKRKKMPDGIFIDRPYRSSSDPERIEYSFHKEWVSIPRTHKSITSVPFESFHNLNEDELAPRVSSATQQAANIFFEAHSLGKEMHEALNSGNKKKSEKIIERISSQLENLTVLGDLPEKKHLVLPLAQGEGREYLPHFLVFTHDPDKGQTLLKHICFSSPLLNKRKSQITTTYNLTHTIANPVERTNFVRSLFNSQPYSRSKDSNEVKLKGPMHADSSLSSLILHYGQEVTSIKGIERKASRDPVKALYEIINQLKIEENKCLSQEHRTLETITESKARFYEVYVNHLISFYEENESRLTPIERAHALDGLLWYAQKASHYRAKVDGADVALSVSEHLIAFVEKKLDELQRTEQLEQKDIKNLNNKISLFEGSLVDDLEEVIKYTETVKDVEGSRVSPKEWAQTHNLRNSLQTTVPSSEERKNAQKLYQDLLRRVNAYLKNGNVLAAKTLLVALMQALPPADDPDKNTTFWDSLGKDEITSWLHYLSILGQKMLEASLRSGTYPLKPHEVFELNVVIPLIQRHLLARKIPFQLEALEGENGILKTYKNNRQIVERLENAQVYFIGMREQEIEKEVREELQKKWEEEDLADKETIGKYRLRLAEYKIELENYEKHKNDRGSSYRYHPGAAPVKPQILSETQKKTLRKAELQQCIEREKQDDTFLNEVKNIDVSNLDRQWDNLKAHALPRTHAVMGYFAKIMGISKELYAYKVGGHKWVGHSLQKKNQAIWLMTQDCSVLVGSSPLFESRYAVCKRHLNMLNGQVLSKKELQHAVHFKIGYENLGNGLLVEEDEEKLLLERVTYHSKGYFNPGKGGEYFVPDELGHICKVDEARKILRDPPKYLSKYSKHSGIIGTIADLLNSEPLTSEALKKKFATMKSIHLVAASRENLMGPETGCFTLSEKPDEKGSIATNDTPEVPATHYERQKYLGQITPEMASEKVGADNERRKVDQVSLDRLYKALDPAQEFILRESALTKSGNPRREEELSYLAISQCMHFIYQYPEKLEIPQIQHTLYKTFFQQGLIKQHLKKNPEFFVRFGKILNEICHFLQEKGEAHNASELFIREVCEKIRRQARAIQDELIELHEEDYAQMISDSLPVYDEEKTVGVFRKKIDSAEQKAFATYALSYFCYNPPRTDNIDAWRDLLKAFFIMQHSPFEIGHSGMQAELLYTVQKELLPLIALGLSSDPNCRKNLLEQLTGRAGVWEVSTQETYVYTLGSGENKFEVDLRTGKGFNCELKFGERCKLPEQIRADEKFRFLFKNMDPMVASKQDPSNSLITDYFWKDEKGGAEFKFRYRLDDRTLQIFQVAHGKTYQFQKLALSEKKIDKIWQIFARHNNKTVEELIRSKGVWIYVDENNEHDTSRVMVAQHGSNLEKDPITLNIRAKKITGASIGKGKDRKWICAGLAGRNSKLLSFRTGGGLLLLSKDKAHVDEIRFPLDPISKEQLILKQSEKNKNVWVVSGREEWVWQLSNTKTYEQRFGKNWREYILPLKNQRSQEEEIWIFPHLAIGGEKRSSEVKILKNAIDFIDYLGGSLGANGLGVDIEELRALVGTAESFMGGADNLLDQAASLVNLNGDDDDDDVSMQSQIVKILKHLTCPRGIKYSINRLSESSSHAGFFYLAHLASLRGDWGSASYFLELMLKNGFSTAEDHKQLVKMAKVVLLQVVVTGKGEIHNLLPKSPLEAAFRAKLTVALLVLNVRLKAQHGHEILDEQLVEDLKKGGAVFYLEYRKGLTTHLRELKENGLLLTKQEESMLTSDFSKMGGVALMMKEKLPEKPNLQPVQLSIPNKRELQILTEVMADYIEPYGVWSIHELHKKQGSYPKWKTVVANFWSYWEWIYENKLSIQDIAFLLREIPPLKDGAEEKDRRKWIALDTARRTLLLFWHYCKEYTYERHRDKHDLSQKAILREIKNAQVEMPNFAEMQSKKERLKQEAAISPGLIKTTYSNLYGLYVNVRQKVNKFTYKEEIGGVEHTRGLKKDFIELSNELLITFLSDATRNEQEAYLVINQDSISQRVIYQPHLSQEKTGPLDALKESSWKKMRTSLQEAVKGSFGFDIGQKLREKNVEGVVRGATGCFLDLPDFQDAWNKFQGFIPQLLQELGIPEALFNLGFFDGFFDSLKGRMSEIHSEYAEKAGFPKSPYVKSPNAHYEPVEVTPASIDLNWSQYFDSSLKVWDRKNGIWQQGTSTWDKRKAVAKKYFDFDPNSTEQREVHKLEKICAGIDKAAEDLKKRTCSSFDLKQLKSVHNIISENLCVLDQKNKNYRSQVLDFARTYAIDLEILHLFVDRNRITDEQIIQKIFDLYRFGQLGRLKEENLRSQFANLITEYILTMTEAQQYEKAKGTCKDLLAVRKQIQKSIPAAITGKEREAIAQTVANRSVDWLLYSADLKRFLEEGSNRLRYTEAVDGKYFLRDQKFTRRYLVNDVRNHWISREKAISSLENMLKDMVEGIEGKPVRFIKAKMGTGKSDFIFPQAIDLLFQRGYEPVMITTDDLVDQLNISMGQSAFVFKFSIDFGLDKVHENELEQLNETDRSQRWKELNTSENIEKHLLTLAVSLENLKADKKSILTSPSQIAALRDKRVQLQNMLTMMAPGNERNNIFRQLQLLKRIEAFFKKDRTIYLVDEDVNFDIAFEYNFATGEFRTVDPIRFDVSELFMHTLMDKHPDLWNLVVTNDLRAIRDVTAEFRDVAKDLFHAKEFWTAVGWDGAIWDRVDEEQFVDFVLGLREDLPEGLPAWDPKIADEKQQNKAYVAALKTFLSKTLDSVKGINPKLERGVSSINGVTAVPFSDGNEKVGVLYGEESENIFHHHFHYAGVGNKIGEEIFLQKKKDLGSLDVRISPFYADTWSSWAANIGRIASSSTYAGDAYKAFIEAPELALARIQFLRHMMLETDFIRVYLEQITFNSQDLGLGVDVRVGSGTGQPFALNLADYTDDSSQDSDEVLGETLLCLNLDRETTTFQGTPLEYIEEKATESQCHAILNFDYEVLGNDCEKLAARLRQKPECRDRQMIYRVQEEQQLVKKIWNPGDHFFPMSYEPGAIDSKGLFLYSRRDGRGVHFHVPRGGHKYGEALVGTGNQEDAIAQLIWRLRHIDMGHDIRFAHDKKTEKQVRTVCQERHLIEENQEVTIGHCMRYFTLNTLAEEGVKNVKAVIYKEQASLKTHLDHVVRKPYNLTNIEDTECLEELEGSVIFAVFKGLYISNNNTQWIREYQPHQTVDSITFLYGLCRDELEKIEIMRTKFLKQMHELIQKHPLARLVKEKNLLSYYSNTIPKDGNVKIEDFEKDLLDVFKNFKKNYSAEQIAVAREVLLKFFAVQVAFIKATHEINQEVERLSKDTEYQNFLKKNLPEEISVDLNEGARNEQRIQQLQEQKREQKQEKTERVMRAASGNEPTRAIDFAHFKNIALGRAKIDSSWEWENNGNFFPLWTAIMKETLFTFPFSNIYKNIYISHRAWKLIHKMGKNGPSVDLLVIQKERGECHTVIITPAEREETVAKALINERNRQLQPLKMAVYPLSNENFSRMIIDGVKEIDEADPKFIHATVMNKLFLNWTKFTIDELEYLIRYVEENKEDANALGKKLANIYGREEYINLETGYITVKSPKATELIKKIVSQEPEWVFEVAKRKLNANYTEFRPQEINALEKWIKKMREIEFQFEKQRLKKINATHSITLLKQIRKEASWE